MISLALNALLMALFTALLGLEEDLGAILRAFLGCSRAFNKSWTLNGSSPGWLAFATGASDSVFMVSVLASLLSFNVSSLSIPAL